jgi:Tfp pilus assembly protein PilO
MTLSDRDRKILLFLVPLVVIAAYWFLLLAPKREEATTASTALTAEQDRLEAARMASSAADSAQSGFETSYATVVRLGKAIPATVDMPSLLVQLESAAAGTGIRFNSISVGDRTEAAAPAPAPAEGGDAGTTPAADAGGAPAQTAPGSAVESANETQQTANADAAAAEQSDVDTTTSTPASDGGGLPVGGGAAAPGAADDGATTAPAGLETIPLTLSFQGNFFNLADFFHRVKRFVRVANDDVLVSGRLLTIESVNWTSNADIFPRLQAEVAATIYLSPLAEGVTAGATPGGPAPSTPAGTETTPAESTSPTAAAPTATATP